MLLESNSIILVNRKPSKPHIIKNLKIKKKPQSIYKEIVEVLSVQAERLELSHLAALDPKSSVSTNSTTPA